jgi:tetratricopeptide (TPR) repeat protein
MQLGPLYSRALNCWGVELQQNGRLTNAALRFNEALELNPDNVVAEINRKCNANLQSNVVNSVGFNAAFEDAFGKFRDWETVMNVNGPFDEPNALLRQMQVFQGGNNFRQAAHCLKRVTELAPDYYDGRLGLAGLLVRARQADEALKIIHALRKDTAQQPFGASNAVPLMLVEAAAYLSKHSYPEAERVINQALEQRTGDEALLDSAVGVYMQYGQYSNALPHVETMLAKNPTNFNSIVNQGFIFMQMSNYTSAVSSFTRAMSLQPTNHIALFNRAVTYLLSKNYKLAKTDYEQLQKDYPTAFEVHYGLGEVAYNAKDRVTAIRHYQLYLSNAPTNSAEAKTVRDRLKELQGNLQ